MPGTEKMESQNPEAINAPNSENGDDHETKNEEVESAESSNVDVIKGPVEKFNDEPVIKKDDSFAESNEDTGSPAVSDNLAENLLKDESESNGEDNSLKDKAKANSEKNLLEKQLCDESKILNETDESHQTVLDQHEDGNNVEKTIEQIDDLQAAGANRQTETGGIEETQSQDQNQETMEETESSLFVIDTRPVEERKISRDVPLFKRARRDILKEKIKEAEEKNDANPNKIRSSCFNCDGDHALKDCDLPRNMKKINKARKLRNTKVERYHNDVDQRFSHLKPGRISQNLAKALGIDKNEIPVMFYKMRKLKYPPAWLEEAKLAHSGIALFGSKGGNILGSDDDEGELEESKLKYDLSKIISFPGFNIHPGPGYYDDYKYQNAPPFSSRDSKEKFIKSFNFNVTKPGYKRRKLNINVDQEDHFKANEEIAVEDMEIDDEDKDICTKLPLTQLLNQPPPPLDKPPTPDVPPPPPDEKESNECDKKEKVNGDELQELTLDDLQAKQAELLNLLNSGNENNHSLDAKNQTKDKQCELGEKSETSNNLDEINSEEKLENSIANIDNSSNDVAQHETPSNQNKCGHLLSSSFGTPVLKFSPYDKLPPDNHFQEGVSDVINFENLPDSTGKYEQMRKLLYKVRKKIVEISETTD